MPNPAAGALQLSWIKAQSSYDTIEAFVAADAVSHINGTFKIEPERTFEESKECSGTMSLTEEFTLGRGGKWSASFLVKPAAVGTAPDIGELIKAAMGMTETIVGATSVTYPLSDTVAPGGLQGVLNIAGIKQEMFSGGWVEEMTVDIPGNGLPTISFSGGFARYGWAFADVVGTGGIAYNATSMPVNNASRGSFGVGAVVQFATDDAGVAGTVQSGANGTFHIDNNTTLTLKVDGGSTQTVTFVTGDFVNHEAATPAEVVTKINSATTGCTAHVTNTDYVSITSDTVGSTSIIQVTGGTANTVLTYSTDAVTGTAGAGYTITAVTQTDGAASITLSPAVVSRAGHAAGIAVTPWVPSRTVGGTVISTPDCSLTIDTVDLGFLSAKIALKTGVIPRDKEATSDHPTGLFRAGKRSVEGEFKFYFLDSATGNAPILGRTWDGTTRDVDIRVGSSTAGSHVHHSLPKCRLDIASHENPEADVVTSTCKFICRKNSAAADEYVMSWD